MKSKLGFFVAVYLAAALFSCGRPNREEALAAYVSAIHAYDGGDAAVALSLAGKSAMLDSSLAPAWNLAGKASFVSGDYARASGDFRRALEKNPASVETRLWLARTQSTPGLEESRERKLLLESVLSDDPGNPYSLRMLAQDASNAGDAKAARILLDNAAAAAGEFGMVFLDRAALRWAAGDFAATMADLDKALALLPEGSVAATGALELRKRILEASE